MFSIREIITNKILIYLFSRYGTYAVQFIVSLGIAAKLGPYYFGIYGFIVLILNYFAQINFGIQHSLNVLIVHNKNEKEICDNYIGNSLWLYFLLSIIIVLFYAVIVIFDIEISQDYPIKKYLWLIVSVAILTYFFSIMVTVLRVRNKIHQLSIVQSLSVIFNLLAVCLFRAETLIYTLVLGQLVSCLLSVFITWKAGVLPNFRNVKIQIKTQAEIIRKGILLFVYNSCFYFILISVRSIISGNYSVESFGEFTFSFTIAHAVLLLLESLMTVIFPKIIDLLSSDNKEKTEQTLEVIRITYVSASHFLIYVAMLFFPLLTFLLPKYANALTSMNLIALAVLMNTNSCAYASLLIAKNKEKTSAVISATALLLNIVLALILVKIMNVGFSYVIIATLLTYLYFSYMVTWQGKKVIGTYNFRDTIKNFFPIRLFIPYLTAFVISVFSYEYLIFLPILLYILFNWRDLVAIKQLGLKLIHNPNMSDV